jgi:probable F420-dependent oxidoreductase
MTAPTLGTVGIWSMELRFTPDRGAIADAAAELDELGYGALWVPGGIDDKVLGDIDTLLDATTRIALATGIINIWKQTPKDVAAWLKAEAPERQSRTMLGLGVSHMPLIGEEWAKTKPLTQMREYIDGLDAAGMPAANTCIAALGPKMVALSGERTAGTHPYLVTPEHSAICREIMGPGKLVAPEQGVVLSTDPDVARGAARKAVDHYRSLPNYRNSWKRLGLVDEDIDAMSDGFIDALFAWGTPETIAERVKAHHDAGADHVCLQVIPPAPQGGLPAARAAWRELAAVLV